MNFEDQKSLYKWGSIALIVLAVFLGAQTLSVFKNLGGTSPSYNSITVIGEGEISSVPDIASFTFAVSAEAATVAQAQQEVSEKMDAILPALENLGIEEKDIKTSDYSIYPRYTYTQGICSQGFCPPGRQVLDGYTASHNVSIKVRDTEKAGDALTLVGEMGATNVSGISFTTDDPEELRNEARTKAIEDAKAKARALARELDVRLVRIVSYSDNSFYPPYPMPYGMGGGVAMEQAMDTKAANIPVGENDTKVNVTLVYEIR